MKIKASLGERIFQVCNYALMILLSLICLYPFVQRFFIKGVMIGSLKG